MLFSLGQVAVELLLAASDVAVEETQVAEDLPVGGRVVVRRNNLEDTSFKLVWELQIRSIWVELLVLSFKPLRLLNFSF